MACLIRGEDGPDLYLIFNADSEPMVFVLPSLWPRSWHLIADTALPSPRDFWDPEGNLPSASIYVANCRSSVVLAAR